MKNFSAHLKFQKKTFLPGLKTIVSSVGFTYKFIDGSLEDRWLFKITISEFRSIDGNSHFFQLQWSV